MADIPVPAGQDTDKQILREKILSLVEGLASSEGVNASDILTSLAGMESADPARAEDRPLGRIAPADEDEDSMADAQIRADSAYMAIGKRAPAPFSGEKALDYRKRALKGVQNLAKEFRDVNIRAVSDSATLRVLEQQIYKAACDGVNWAMENTPGYLHKTVRMDEAGRRITEYSGDPNAWLSTFKIPGRALVKINTNHH